MNITKELFNNSDEKYKNFQSSLIPTIPKDKIIGVRIPYLRSLAKRIKFTDDAESFLKVLPHRYYEEDHLHAFLIEQYKSFDQAVTYTDEFLPFIDNWATCDSLNPKIFKSYTNELIPYINKWLCSNKTYTVRFAVKILMTNYLEDAFLPIYPHMLAEIESEEYYINMAIAWYFATALAKQYDSVIPYLENRSLSPWIHAKTVQKSLESFRISDVRKKYIRSLR